MVRDFKLILICLVLAAITVFAYSLKCHKQGSRQSTVNSQLSTDDGLPTDSWKQIPNAGSPQTTTGGQQSTDNRPLTPVQSKTVDRGLLTVDSITHDTVYLAVDTAQILREYFTQHLYKEVYSDPLLDIEVTDSIFQNRLVTQSVRYKTKPQAPKIQVWAGVSADTRKTTAIHLLVKDKKERLFGVGYTTDKAVCFSVAMPLFKTGGTY